MLYTASVFGKFFGRLQYDLKLVSGITVTNIIAHGVNPQARRVNEFNIIEVYMSRFLKMKTNSNTTHHREYSRIRFKLTLGDQLFPFQFSKKKRERIMNKKPLKELR
jgi:hypothetical protein